MTVPGPTLRLVAARARAAELMPYLGTALYACTPVETTLVPTLAVDERWHLYWNPDFCAGLTVAELAGAWLHEVGHLLREHAARFAALGEPQDRWPLFNVAADAAINVDLFADRIEMPPGAVTLAAIPGGWPTMTAEQLYRLLVDREHPVQIDCGSGTGGGRRPWDVDDGGVDEVRGELIRRQVARDVAEHERQRGDVPAGWRRWADQHLNPRVDWRRELRAVVRRQVAEIAGRRDYTYARPSRRQVPGVILPAMRQPRPPVVYAVIDTSGSMSAYMLGRCVAEIEGIVRRTRLPGQAGRGPAVRLVACDASPGAVQAIRSADDIVLTGGGGTDLRPALEVVAALRPAADLIVVLTDGYTPWDTHPPRANPGARYVAVLVAGEVPVPAWVRPIVIHE